MSIPITIAAAAATAAVVVVVVLLMRRGPSRSSWSAFASARGLTLHTDALTIDGVVEGVEVILQTFDLLTRGRRRKHYTRVEAKSPTPPELWLAVVPENGLAELEPPIGYQDVVIGAGAFDAAYIIKTSKDEVARTVLVEEVRQRIVALHKSALGGVRELRFGYSDGAVSVQWLSARGDVERLPVALALVLSVAHNAPKYVAPEPPASTPTPSAGSTRSQRRSGDRAAPEVGREAKTETDSQRDSQGDAEP